MENHPLESRDKGFVYEIRLNGVFMGNFWQEGDEWMGQHWSGTLAVRPSVGDICTWLCRRPRYRGVLRGKRKRD